MPKLTPATQHDLAAHFSTLETLVLRPDFNSPTAQATFYEILAKLIEQLGPVLLALILDLIRQQTNPTAA